MNYDKAVQRIERERADTLLNNGLNGLNGFVSVISVELKKKRYDTEMI